MTTSAIYAAEVCKIYHRNIPKIFDILGTFLWYILDISRHFCSARTINREFRGWVNNKELILSHLYISRVNICEKDTNSPKCDCHDWYRSLCRRVSLDWIKKMLTANPRKQVKRERRNENWRRDSEQKKKGEEGEEEEAEQYYFQNRKERIREALRVLARRRLISSQK